MGDAHGSVSVSSDGVVVRSCMLESSFDDDVVSVVRSVDVDVLKVSYDVKLAS